MQVQYVGPHDAVDVPLPNGQTATVARGEKANITKEVAEGLLLQGEDHWKPVGVNGAGTGAKGGESK
jgi:hypothetical protein